MSPVPDSRSKSRAGDRQPLGRGSLRLQRCQAGVVCPGLMAPEDRASTFISQ